MRPVGPPWAACRRGGRARQGTPGGCGRTRRAGPAVAAGPDGVITRNRGRSLARGGSALFETAVFGHRSGRSRVERSGGWGAVGRPRGWAVHRSYPRFLSSEAETAALREDLDAQEGAVAALSDALASIGGAAGLADLGARLEGEAGAVRAAHHGRGQNQPTAIPGSRPASPSPARWPHARALRRNRRGRATWRPSLRPSGRRRTCPWPRCDRAPAGAR